ncbi:DJ-1/PfpI family protein [Rubellicoccus peritrichatus]|uniref:DJ-1/PfpI family protein n=1 Tax=Rubellicoccus peritrichatus TaxID=3080537 RepID=A0AAQ3LAI0_9BACT|nr:DJ-1/PfpI family protein [Puniceicoccus sp. CR14]WOO42111.1 DJ-1/PfpI family protein [Puniceicoccus sp. CR14]
MRLGFLVFNGVEELDLTGPWELVGELKKRGKITDAFMISPTMERLTCAKQMQLVPHHSYENCPSFDVLIVPGGEGRRREVDNPETIQFIKDKASKCQAVLSVCTGAFLLEKAGLLENVKATTHWSAIEELRALGVTVVEDRFINNGPIWTSAGVSAGIDMILAFIAEKLGPETAGEAQLYAEYFPDGTVYGEPWQKPEVSQYIKSLSAQS